MLYTKMFPFITIFHFFIFILFCVVNAYGLNFDYSFENTNVAAYMQEQRFTDFNRLRFQTQIDDEIIPGLAATLIVDNQSNYFHQESDFDNEFVLYRAYIEYGTDKHLFVAGRQRIPFGVGRLWNPIDIFNPVDSTSIEPGEREGVDAFRYEYAFSDLTNCDFTIASDKGAVRIKGFYSFADLALVALVDDDRQRVIVGWEIEGELWESGIDLRSEGGSFYDRDNDEYHTEFIIGGEYGFANSLTFLLEYYYNDNGDGDHLGMTISFQPSTLLLINVLAMVNLDDNSTLLAPTLTYSISDEMTLEAGVFLYRGDSDETFGESENMGFLKWFIHF